MTVPGGKPVMAVPGLTPTFPPWTTVGPALVTGVPARTAKLAAEPSVTSDRACNGRAASATTAGRIRVLYRISQLLFVKKSRRNRTLAVFGCVGLLTDESPGRWPGYSSFSHPSIWVFRREPIHRRLRELIGW